MRNKVGGGPAEAGESPAEGGGLLNVGVVGVGNISRIYLENLTSRFSSFVRVVGCADLVSERASEAARAWELPRAYRSVDELLADPEVDIVLNLTIPAGHHDVCARALEAGKHVYVEKPLSIDLDDGARLMAKSGAKGLRVGAAPDTFLGAGLQTCRRLIDEGVIGDPVGAQAFMLSRGHESWHPAPEFYYKQGGGPMFDMGPYYLTALVSLLGPVASVAGATSISFPRRTITSEPLAGQIIDVEVPTHVLGLLTFASGAIASISMSFDVAASEVPRIEIFGSEGTLSVPDPNGFGGPVRIRRRGGYEWREVPVELPYADNSRGLGLADMAAAIANGRPHRASGELGNHVLEIMHGVHIAADAGKNHTLCTTAVRPEPLGEL